jgi:hypothetical protein
MSFDAAEAVLMPSDVPNTDELPKLMQSAQRPAIVFFILFIVIFSFLFKFLCFLKAVYLSVFTS